MKRWCLILLILCLHTFVFHTLCAGRTYLFNKNQECERIAAAREWRELLLPLAEQVRLHMYCAERVKLSVNDYEYFQRDWDEPLEVAGRSTHLHTGLYEWINNLTLKNVPSALVAIYQESMPRKCFLEALWKGSLEAREKNIKEKEGSIKRATFSALYKAALSSAQVERRARREKLEQFCRAWLMARGKISKDSKASEKSENFAGVEPAVSVVASILIDEPLFALYKKELLKTAHEVRWKYEWSTKGMDSFMHYLACSEHGFTSKEKAAAFCCSLAVLVNAHVSLYGCSSLLAIEGNQGKLSFDEVKILLQDSIQRFYFILTQTFSKESFVAKEYPFSEGLNEKQQTFRVLFADKKLERLAEELVRSGPPGHIVPEKLPKPKRPVGWHPPVSDAEKLWDKLQLIDEISVLPQEPENKICLAMLYDKESGQEFEQRVSAARAKGYVPLMLEKKS